MELLTVIDQIDFVWPYAALIALLPLLFRSLRSDE